MRRLALFAAMLGTVVLLGACRGHTDDATNLTATSATLNAHGKATDGSGRAFFRWGTSPSALTNTTPGATYPANVEGPFSETITGLSPSTTYYFRACATDGIGTNCAELHDFKTLSAAGEAVVVAAGDIGDDTPSPNGQDETGGLTAMMDPHKVLTLGDNAYEDATLADHVAHYAPWWGDPHGVDRGGANGFGDRTRPTLGNHEYQTPNAEGAFDFFNGQYTKDGTTFNFQFGLAGARGQGYYYHDVGSWRLIALNTSDGGSIDSAQLDWLAARVAENPKPCLLAYFHHPRWVSRSGQSNSNMGSIWTRLWSASNTTKRADLILNGHIHHYDRFARQNLTGGADAGGMRQVTVGTGGVDLVDHNTPHPRSEVRLREHGVLRLTLRSTSAVGQFFNASGTVRDTFTENCH